VLDAFAQLNDLLAKDTYDPQDKAAIVELLKQLGLKSSDESKWVTLRRDPLAGALGRRPRCDDGRRAPTVGGSPSG
jgi:hypothetical protein